MAPEIMKTRMRMRATLIPARRAASAFPPTAYTWRPKVVRFATNVQDDEAATTSRSANGTPAVLVQDRGRPERDHRHDRES